MRIVRQITSGQASLATEIVGSGRPVVFLHAHVCDRRMWLPQLDAIGTRDLAIAYDRRGYGGTRAAPEDFSAVADLMAIIDCVAGGRAAVLVGCSFGGKIAIDAALRHPSRVAGLVLIAPNVDGAPEPVHPPEVSEVLERQQAAQDAGDLHRVNAIKARLWLDGPMATEGRVMGSARQLFLDMSGTVLRAPPVKSNLDIPAAFGQLGRIDVPTLVLYGDLDFPHIRDRCRLMAEALPQGLAQELAGTAHLPSLEQPAVINEHVLSFLRRLPGGR
jgi:pimeloyl-ACP methyl ester carboxylesterase